MREYAPSQEIAYLVENTEARAYADLLRAAPPAWQWRAEESDLFTLLFAPTIDIPIFNRVIGLGLNTPASPAAIEFIIRRYGDAGIRNFAIQLSPAAQPGALAAMLPEHGLRARDRWAKVYRSDAPPPQQQSGISIERIGTERAETFAAIALNAFRIPESAHPWLSASVGRPAWHHYLAIDGGKAIAAAAMFVRDRVAWLGIAGTLSAHRKMGAQGLLMKHRIQDGLRLGCRWFVTETGEDTPERPNPSFHNMIRNGFVLAYQRPNYMRPPGSG